MKAAIAVVGLACRFPDARTPSELWENVLAQRRAFRRLPRQRLNAADYFSSDRSVADTTYAVHAAVIADYEFDRSRFRVPGSTYRQADLAHWLALDVASEALADAGYADARDLPRDSTGVLLGNTLTGEFSRANLMRLRWPYVRRVVEAVLQQDDWPRERRAAFMSELETRYKAPFPAVGDETLAGGLSNTIAGRICNHFDLHGGGYTVDGACASSLLAIATACSSLTAGDLDVALAGGVDLSLDPFEIVGFAKIGALAPSTMRVYDKRSSGFWPGEGCGMVVLMRAEDAIAARRRIYAIVRGWGVSSDGGGGLTRPEVDGQRLAVSRAYARAGYGPDTVAYFEGHGTGTAIGDPIELRVLSESIRAASSDRAASGPVAAIGSIKANIGHTKAAAGVAGFLKTTLALHHQILPPTTACDQPQDELLRGDPVLRVLPQAEAWPADRAARAACSAMGFGGINTHVTLEGVVPPAETDAVPLAVTISRSPQDAELFCFSGNSSADVAAQIEPVAAFAAQLSLSELTDLAVELSKRVRPGRVRAAVVAATTAELASSLALLQGWLTDGVADRLDAKAGVYLGTIDPARPRRIGFLFPGQASPSYFDAGPWRRRFAAIERLYAGARLEPGTDPKATEIAQPAICCAERAGLLALAECGIEAEVGIGHSVGELAALCWAGVLDTDALLHLARTRGQAMAQDAVQGGAMASIGAAAESVARWVADGAVIAAINAPDRTVVSGDAAAVHRTVQRAKLEGHDATLLSVSHAFHSPHMLPVAARLAHELASVQCLPLRRRVVSTVTGRGLSEGDDVRSLLVQQLTQPVRFAQALASAPDVDLWLEVGPGRVLAGVAAGQTDTPVVALDASSDALAGLLHACGAAFALGTTVRLDRLFAARFARPFDVDWQPRFFVNPCEMAPESAASPLSEPAATPGAGAEAPPPAAGREDPLSVFREIVAQHLELPIELVSEASHLLTDLHLNSITVGQLVGQACRRLGLPGPGAATEYATASVGEVGQALVELRRLSDGATFAPEPVPDGIDAWVRAFELEWIEQPLEPASANTSRGRWSLFAPDDHPLAAALRAAFATAPGSGAVVCMPVSLVQCNVGDLLAGARVALDRDVERLVIVQHSAGHPGAPPGGGFAKTVHLEAPRVAVRVVDVPFDHPDAVRWILAEAVGAGGFAEARYDTAGRRTEPRLRLLRAAHGEAAPTPLTSADVVLVTGGGKGIAAECALALAKRSGVRLAILGRSSPDADADLAHNLARLREAGAIVHYAAADVCDATAVRAAVDAAQAALGPITAIVHGAGTNVPQPVLALDEAACIRTLQPKVQGLQNVLQAVQPERLRHLVTFSSIIGRMGLAGEADYALANEWLSSLTRRFAIEYPRCHCLALEWSVWSGAGMGQRLGRMDALLQRGVTPIAVEPGVEALLDLMSRPVSDPVVVVSGRFGTPATLRLQSSEPPLLRFVEKSRVQYPGVELVVDVELSGRTDPYVDEHVYQRQPLFPAVMGLEAMLQVASSLAEDDRLPVLENVQLQRPIVVPPRGSQRIQIAALVREPGCVDVAVRCADTSFKLDHFRATCRFGAAAAPRQTAFATGNGGADIEPQRDLYDAGVLFHQGRFQRIAAYELLCAQECRARLNVRPSRAWFAGFMPDRLLLGDAAARDAAIHAIQACIPHERVLPVGVERILPGRLDQRAARVRARERQRARGSFVYDLEILDADGRVLESWDGLHLKTIEPLPARQSWPAPLLAAYVERRVAEFMPHSGVQVALEHDRGADRQASSQHAVDVAVGSSAPLVRRPDGKPELAGHGSGGNGSAGDGLAGHDLEGNGRTGNGGANRGVSVSHAGGLTFAVVGHGPVGCDIEPVTHRSLAAWNDVCGERHMQLANLVARESREDIDTAATRVWVALESLKKAGVPADAPVLIDAAQPGGDVTFTCGRWTAATQVASIGSDPMRLAVCVVAGAAEPGPDR